MIFALDSGFTSCDTDSLGFKVIYAYKIRCLL